MRRKHVCHHTGVPGAMARRSLKVEGVMVQVRRKGIGKDGIYRPQISCAYYNADVIVTQLRHGAIEFNKVLYDVIAWNFAPSPPITYWQNHITVINMELRAPGFPVKPKRHSKLDAYINTASRYTACDQS